MSRGKKEKHYERLLAGQKVYLIKTIKQCQRKIAEIIRQLRKESSLPEDFFYELQTAANEICYNAVEHGNLCARDKFVQIKYHKGEKEIVFMVEDQGSGFNLDEIANPTLPENILKPRGRGIFLARNMLDELIFCQEGRRVYLIKRIKKGS